jgi:hypothetical protein
MYRDRIGIIERCLGTIIFLVMAETLAGWNGFFCAGGLVTLLYGLQKPAMHA